MIDLSNHNEDLISVSDASRREVSNSYALTEDEFSRLMDELNLD